MAPGENLERALKRPWRCQREARGIPEKDQRATLQLAFPSMLPLRQLRQDLPHSSAESGRLLAFAELARRHGLQPAPATPPDPAPARPTLSPAAGIELRSRHGTYKCRGLVPRWWTGRQSLWSRRKDPSMSMSQVLQARSIGG